MDVAAYVAATVNIADDMHDMQAGEETMTRIAMTTMTVSMTLKATTAITTTIAMTRPGVIW